MRQDQWLLEAHQPPLAARGCNREAQGLAGVWALPSLPWGSVLLPSLSSVLVSEVSIQRVRAAQASGGVAILEGSLGPSSKVLSQNMGGLTGRMYRPGSYESKMAQEFFYQERRCMKWEAPSGGRDTHHAHQLSSFLGSPILLRVLDFLE